MTPDPPVDMTAAKALLDKLTTYVDSLDGAEPQYEFGNNKERMRATSALSRDLLYAGHLADALRLEILNQYHHWRGQPAPRVTS